MKPIVINNTGLTDIINIFLDTLLSVDRSKFPYGPNGKKPDNIIIDPESACGDEYLQFMQNKKVDGFPEVTHGCDLGQWKPPQPELRDALKKLDNDLLAWSGSRNNAVKMLYPKGGYMGWHHNANASGYNILLSWSKEGTGYFRYQDPVTKEIVTMHDTPGWTCKVGYYGKFTEADRIYWHCANAAHEERFTLGYIIPHLGMWEDMCADIQST
jgi:hypothetical protein